MNVHMRILGWLYLGMGIFSLGSAGWFAYATYSHGPGSYNSEIQHILIEAGYGTMLLVLLIVAALGSIATGYLLLKQHRSARSLARAFAIVGLIDFPFGTMLGVYTLWALAQSSGDDVPKQLSPKAAAMIKEVMNKKEESEDPSFK